MWGLVIIALFMFVGRFRSQKINLRLLKLELIKTTLLITLIVILTMYLKSAIWKVKILICCTAILKTHLIKWQLYMSPSGHVK